MRISDWSSYVGSSDLAGAAFVGMAFERDANRRVALQPLRLALQRRLILRIDVILVIIEEDAVALQTDVGEEVFLRPRDHAGAGAGAGVGSCAFGSGGKRVRGLFRAGANSKHGDRRDHRGDRKSTRLNY